MGERSAIQWTTHTFNPWVGCTKVSAGCTNCYAEAYDRRVGGVPIGKRERPDEPISRWGKGAPRTRTTESYWRQPLRWAKEAAAVGERHRVFCASLADVFDEAVDPAWRAELYGLILATPELDWLLLTKRPEQFAANRFSVLQGSPFAWPMNVWLGVTVENQEQADRRIPLLAAERPAVRFLSCEPLLEQVDLSAWLDEDANGFVHLIDWVIIGGESGAKARAFHTDWARDLIQQCRDGGRGEAAPFVKQLGSNAVASGRDQLALLDMKDHHGGEPAEWPEDLRVREFPVGLRGH